MLRVCVAFATLVGFAASAAARPPAVSPDPKTLAVPPEEVSKARALVQKLGSESFADRELADRELAAMGRLACAALRDGVSLDPDPEVRARCRMLLPKAAAEDVKARLDAFLADTDGRYEHDLPGWRKLRSTVRGEWTVFGWTHTARPNADKGARKLFIEFMEAPGGRQLLAALDGPGGDLGQMIAVRRTELYTAKYPRVGNVTPREPSVGEIGVVVFAESQVKASAAAARTLPLSTVISNSTVAVLARGTDDRATAMRAVMAAWFDSRTDPLDAYQAMSVANSMQDDGAAARLAARVMTAAGLAGVYKGQALTTLVRLKATDHLSALEGAFTDTTALATTVKALPNGARVRESVEVRDAALAAAVVITGQSPADYGFDGLPAAVGGRGFAYTAAKLPDDKRKDAFEKWKAWREKNP